MRSADRGISPQSIKEVVEREEKRFKILDWVDCLCGEANYNDETLTINFIKDPCETSSK